MQTPRTHTKWWGFLQHYWINSSDVWYVYGQCWKKTVYVLMQLFIFYNGKNFDRSLLIGDPKETYYIGPIEDTSIAHLNQWPSEGMVFLCIHFIRNRYCILVCVGFVLHKLDLRCFSGKDTSELLPNWRPTMKSLYWKLLWVSLACQFVCVFHVIECVL